MKPLFSIPDRGAANASAHAGQDLISPQFHAAAGAQPWQLLFPPVFPAHQSYTTQLKVTEGLGVCGVLKEQAA